MKRFFAVLVLVAMAACSPPPQTNVMVVREAQPEADWLATFRATHGSDYDPLSRLDREKMLALKGTEKPAEVSMSDRGPAGIQQSFSPQEPRESILAVARPLIGQTETHGKNRSPQIDAMNQLTGVPMRSPYRASFNAWCYNAAKAPGAWPRSAWSPSWVAGATWTAAKGGKTPQPADTFGIWGQPAKKTDPKRIIHTGLIESWGAQSAVTIEANTSPSAEFGAAADREGDGIWRKRRLRSQIHSVRDWLGD